MSVSKKNMEGYLDLTVYEALSNIERSEKRARRKPPRSPGSPLPLVYVTSPYRGDTAMNVQNAVRYCRYVLSQDKMPIAPHIWLPQFMDDGDLRERRRALGFGLWLLAQCREVWVFGGHVSDGMKGEIDEAKLLRKNIRYITDEQIKERRILE